MTAQTSEILVGFLGLIVGAAITYLWRFSERKQTEAPPPAEPRIPTGVTDVLSVLHSSTVLLDEGGRVVQASAPAIAMGIIRDDRIGSPAINELVTTVRQTGDISEGEFEIPQRRSAPIHVHARVAPLAKSLILVLLQDRSVERRLEMMRRDFVANVSHELKTPIGAINLLAEAVGEAADEPDAVKHFSDRIKVESERLTRLVQQIIDLSRLQSHEHSEEMRLIKVVDLLAEAIEPSLVRAESQEMHITSRVDAELMVFGDRGQLHAALANLVENAVTHSPAGSNVSLVAEPKGSDVIITVSDTGVGIPDDEQERIFERFYRVDPARSRETGGTGLGLSIVKHVVASHGGTIDLWSKPGLGSTFTLVLPGPEPDEENT